MSTAEYKGKENGGKRGGIRALKAVPTKRKSSKTSNLYPLYSPFQLREILPFPAIPPRLFIYRLPAIDFLSLGITTSENT